MRKMGGLWRRIPWTYALMWVGSLSLAGIWPFSGAYSKDTIVESAWAAGTGVGLYGFCLGVFAAFLTAFYSWRLIFLTFHGAPRADEETVRHVHESPWVMVGPLLVLGIGAVIAGRLGYNLFVGAGNHAFWRDSILVLPDHASLAHAEDVPVLVSLSPLVAALAGIAAAWLCYILAPDTPGRIARSFRAVYLFLLNKWYFDELYDAVIVRPLMALGVGLWKKGDGTVIDGLGPDGISARTRDIAVWASRLQTGYLYHYAFAMLIGVVGLVSWYLLRQMG
jgi:NADH-quinone oxidoreductase subunit L